MNQITTVTTFEYDHKDRVIKETVVSTEIELDDAVQPVVPTEAHPWDFNK